jgi:hypothetical protein
MKNWIEMKIYTFFPQTREEDLYIRLGYELLFGALIIMSAHFYLSLIPQIQDVLPIKMLVITCLTISFVTKFVQIFADELPIIIIISYFSFIVICITITIFNIEIPNVFENYAGGWTELANRKTVGTIFSSAAQEHTVGFKMTSSKSAGYNTATAHFAGQAYNKELIMPDFEGTQKVNMWKRTEDLNQYFRNTPPIKIIYPPEQHELGKFVAKGGDIIIMEGTKTDLVIVELKFRHTPFETQLKVGKYIDTIYDYYEKPMPIPIMIDADTKIIYNDLLNYIKESPDGKVYCFSEEELKNPINIEQLKNFKTKDKFSHIIIRDASYYHNTPTEHELTVAESMGMPLKELTKPASVQANSNSMNNIKNNPCFTVRNLAEATEFLIENYANPENELKIKYAKSEY